MQKLIKYNSMINDSNDKVYLLIDYSRGIGKSYIVEQHMKEYCELYIFILYNRIAKKIVC